MPNTQNLQENNTQQNFSREYDNKSNFSAVDGREALNSHASADSQQVGLGNSEYYQLQGSQNDSVQIQRDLQQSVQYDSASQRQIFSNVQQPVSEQRQNAHQNHKNATQTQSHTEQHYHSQESNDSVQSISSKMGEMGQIKLGTAETPAMMKLQQKIQADRAKEYKLYRKIEEVKSTRIRISIAKDTAEPQPGEEEKKDSVPLYDKRNPYDTESVDKLQKSVDGVLDKRHRLRNRNTGQEFSRIVRKEGSVGKLKFEKETRYRKVTKGEYDKKIRKKDKKDFCNRIKGRLMFAKAKGLVNDEDIREDELAGDYKRMLRNGYRSYAHSLRKNAKYLRDTYNKHARLKSVREREKYHLDKQKRLNNKYERQARRDKLRGAATKEERKRLKKKMRRQQAEKEGNFIKRTFNQLKMTKRSVAYKQQAVKKTFHTIWSIGSILMSLFSFLVIALPVIMGIAYGSGEYFSTAVVQGDYGDITEATEYFRNLEADLDEFIASSTTEQNLKANYGYDIYEINYNLADLGFSANTVIAYLGAKYGEIKLDSTMETDLQDIFQEMYTLNIEIKNEYRNVEDTSVTDANGNHPIVSMEKKICYVNLVKKELEEVVEARLTEEQLVQYETYKLSTGGQQVYGPVMKEDWTNKISSNYGDRIHPISGERKTHKGVDIAVPEGTKLYSAVKGTVTTAHYSTSAGNMVTIQNDTGWSVTFMHMKNYAVFNGQQVEKGDFVGSSGNTGNSTGPHLHLQVTDPNGNTINPIFIIPQTCAVRNEGGENN